MINIEGKNYHIDGSYDADVFIRIFEPSEDGEVPQEVKDYISSGGKFGTLILRNDEPLDYDFFIQFSDRIKSLSLHGKFVDWISIYHLEELESLLVGDGVKLGAFDFSKLKKLKNIYFGVKVAEMLASYQAV